MNRTDRLYAIVEELRAVAPRPRSARWLASRFEVSVRTIERDLTALQETGVPVYAEPGRTGGYAIDPRSTLPPLNVTPAESAAIALALEGYEGPFASDARTALSKVLAGMPAQHAAQAEELVGRVRLMNTTATPPRHPVAAVIEEAVARQRVVRLSYVDKTGAETRRDVEPISLIGHQERWYLLGWCRLRGCARAFRLDRVQRAVLTGEAADPQHLADALPAEATAKSRPLRLVR
jgi:predicted DNA-binding transcriptional regulator YafY